MKDIYLCLDVGGTEIKAAPVDAGGALLQPLRHFPARSHQSAPTLLDHFASVLQEISPGQAISGIRLAFPGPFDYEAGICLLQGLGKFDALYGVNLRHALACRMDIEPEAGQIVISRKITTNRSINKINGESVPVGVIRKVSALCIDIHGQHEHQSLLHKEYHRSVVDRFAGEEAQGLKQKIAGKYEEYRNILQKMEENGGSEKERARELSFLEYERKEIEEAKLKEGEEEKLEDEVKKMSNASDIVESMGKV